MQHPGFARRECRYLQIKSVELFPHLGAALFAHLPQIFSRGRNARRDEDGFERSSVSA